MYLLDGMRNPYRLLVFSQLLSAPPTCGDSGAWPSLQIDMPRVVYSKRYRSVSGSGRSQVSGNTMHFDQEHLI